MERDTQCNASSGQKIYHPIGGVCHIQYVGEDVSSSSGPAAQLARGFGL
jgi:hypothetical protein